MDHLSSSHQLTECGHVYVNVEDSSFFLINCLFCNEKLYEWSLYVNHIQGHLQKQQEEYGDDIHEKWEIKSEYPEEVEGEEPIQSEATLDDQQYEPANTADDWEIKTEELLDNKTDDVIIKEHLEGKNLEDYNDELMEEYLMKDSIETNSEYLESDIECSNDQLTENATATATKSKVHPTHHPKTSFFRISTTDTDVMLKFIQLLSKYPSLWDHIPADINNKEKRKASCLELTKELREHFNLNISPQGTRSSVLYLVRWFEQECIRLMRCEQKDLQFVSMRNDYFEKLLEFLPYKNLKAVACDECFKHFKYEHLLMAHKHKYHNGAMPFQCRYCGRGFLHHSSYKLHENRHIKVQLWPCKMCLYQASTKADYIKHLATHSSKQPYKCDVCGLCYKTSSNLNVHKKSHGLPQYECEVCNKKFYEKYRYKRHIWMHDKGEQQTWQSIDNFTCHICGRRFTSNTTLMKHKLVHIHENYDLDDVANTSQTQNKQVIVVYYCNYCSLEFIDKTAYKTHMHLKHNKE